MDVTPQLLREVELREQWRGYDKNEVDDLLERVAVAVEELTKRAARAERLSADRSAPDRSGPDRSAPDRTTRDRSGADSPDEDSIRRTLVLAQRTADAAIAEARDEAAEVSRQAEAAATEVRQGAEARASKLLADAESRVTGELRPLLEQRVTLVQEIDQLRSWLVTARAGMADQFRQQLALVEDVAAPPPAPEVSEVALPGEGAGDAEGEVGERPVEGRPSSEDDGVSPASLPDEEASAGDGDGHDGSDPDGGDWGGDTEEDTGGFRLEDPAATGLYGVLAEPDVDLRGSGDGGQVPPTGSASSRARPPGRASARARPDGADGDPFMAELRRAVTDREPLGPRDHHPVADGDVEELAPSLFRRRRRQ